MRSALALYRTGRRATAWKRLVALGGTVRMEPHLSEALAVASETMARARENLERLIERLDAAGYRFATARRPEWLPRLAITNPFTGQPMPGGPRPPTRKPMVFDPPGPDAGSRLDEMERLVGPLPLSLRVWYEVVGEVNFTGSYPDWPFEGLDPLVIPGLDAVVRSAEDWRRADRGAGSESFSYALPDDLLKDGISGAFHEIRLPDASVDAPISGWDVPGRVDETTFVDYLRHVFRWGGFAGMSRRAFRRKPEFVSLRRGLLRL